MLDGQALLTDAPTTPPSTPPSTQLTTALTSSGLTRTALLAQLDPKGIDLNHFGFFAHPLLQVEAFSVTPLVG